MWRIASKFLIIIAALLAFLAYGFLYEVYRGTQSYSHLSKRRMDAAVNNEDKTVHVAVVWATNEDPSFTKGIDIAVEEINHTGMVLKNPQGESAPSKLVIHNFADTTHRDADQATSDIVADKRIVAVLGYSHSSRAIPASISFEYNGILFLSTAATQSTLTNHRFKYVFSLGPIDEQYYIPIIEFAEKKQYKTLAVLYDRNSTGRNFFATFLASIGNKFQLIYKKSLPRDSFEQMNAIYYAAASKADAIALGIRSSEDTAKIINKLREMGYAGSILGTKAMDIPNMPALLNGAGRDIYVSTLIKADPTVAIDKVSDSQTVSQMLSRFQEKYYARYETMPGVFAYQGYFSMYLYKKACEKAGSSAPLSVAAALKYGKLFDITFDEHNRRSDIVMHLKAISGDKFVDVD